MRKMTLVKKMLWMLVFPFIFSACESKMDKHYDLPAELDKGSIWEALEDRGNYSIFLKGIELSGYKQIVEGKSILTVMAPDDDAFAAYLAKEGKSSIEDYSQEELSKLIGFHLLYYSYNKDKLINYNIWGDGETEDYLELGAGMYYKHRTKSYDAPTYEMDTTGKPVKVYHNERFLPVFNYRLFETKKIDAKYNYEYFYPGSTWTGDNGFNVSEASVKEYSMITDNGYLYTIDRVLEPLETIYTELKSQPEYSRYLEMYDQYSYYSYDPQLSLDFGGGDSLYQHYHESLPNIACEWPTSNYRQIWVLSSMSYSVFAPSNTAFDNFFESYWLPGGYTSLANVSPIAMRYLLRNSISASSIVFPEEIKNGSVASSFDDKVPITFDVDAVAPEKRVMCVNGAFYGLDKLEPPSMFYSIVGPAFRNEKQNYYLHMLDASNLLTGFSTTSATFTALIPNNSQMEAAGVSVVDDELYYSDGGEDGPMSNDLMTAVVNLHTVTGVNGINPTGLQVLKTNIPKTYWYVKDGKLLTSGNFNEKFQYPTANVPFVDLVELKNGSNDWNNGKAYTYDRTEMFMLTNENVQATLAVNNDNTRQYYEFTNLLQKAGLRGGGQLLVGTGGTFLIFIPTNTAIQSAISSGKIPGLDSGGNVINQAALADYMKCYFITMEIAGISEYFYIGSGVKGLYPTEGDSFILLNDNGNSLSVQRVHEGSSVVNVVSTYDYFPFAFDDGGVQFIDGVL